MQRPNLTPLNPSNDDGQHLLRDVYLEGAERTPMRLQMIETNERRPTGQSVVQVNLYDAGGARVMDTWIGASPLHAIDSDDTLRAAINAISIRPGDTDAEFFDSYSPEQLAFVNQHGEELTMYTIDDDPYPITEWDDRPAPVLDGAEPAPSPAIDGPAGITL